MTTQPYHTSVFYNVGYAFETYPILKFHENYFAHNLLHCRSIILKFRTERGSDTAMLCAKFQNDWPIWKDEWGFVRFKFEVNFKGVT